jgi:interleukin-1 receptor-associated kinase 1
VMMKTPMMTSLMERQEKKRKEADIQVSPWDFPFIIYLVSC